jgi:hypothetical protein
MMPDRFPEKNKTLGAPASMQDSCDPLDVWTDGKVCISRWRMTWRERIAALVFGRVWVRVYSGASQPPIALQSMRTVFQERTWWQWARDFIRSRKHPTIRPAR